MSSTPSSQNSVRNLYTPPQEEWLFLPPTVSPSKIPADRQANGSGYPSTTTTTESRYSTEITIDDLDDEPFSLYGLAQVFAAEYLTTALGMPFEVGKTLLQVEYKPKEGVFTEEGVDVIPDEDVTEERDWGAEDDQLSNPEEAEAYFSDVLNTSSRQFPPSIEPDGETLVAPDEDGYLPDLHPSYLIRDDVSPSGSTGVWGMMRRIRRTPSEGLPSLWKGQLITTVHSLLSTTIEPALHTLLLVLIPDSATEVNTSFQLPLASYPSPALPLGLHVASHLITHLFLSPLELVRTRLIVQPSSLPSSQSSVSMAKSIINEEGGISSLYLDPHLLIPSILEHTIRPLLTLSIPLFIERQLNISPDVSPITYSLLDLSLGLASLLIILPIETIRKRLQIQDRNPPRAITKRQRRTIVRTRERDYVGVVEGLWRIVSEETTIPGKKRNDGMRESVQNTRLDGIRQLYRGFGMAATAHLTVFGLGLVSAGLGGRVEYGWQEI